MTKAKIKRVSLAGFLASGFTILAGLIVSLMVVFASADSPGPYTALVLITFALITLVPLQALRERKDPAEKKARRWRWGRKKKQPRRGPPRRVWSRKPGQAENKPFGTPELPRPSTFVPARRRPTGP